MGDLARFIATDPYTFLLILAVITVPLFGLAAYLSLQLVKEAKQVRRPGFRAVWRRRRCHSPVMRIFVKYTAVLIAFRERPCGWPACA